VEGTPLAVRPREAMSPFTVRAPGRVNLIGEHTDYNDGFVLPMAINRSTNIAVTPHESRTVTLRSLHHGETAEFSLENLAPDASAGWVKYAHAVAGALSERSFGLRGFTGTVGGDIPLGAGLSSSASFAMAVAMAFAECSGFSLAPLEMARICLRAEQHWVGLNCGIMDQLVCACAIEHHALLIDCRSIAIRAVPLPERTDIIILDTGRRRSLTESAYNDREAECTAAARACGVASVRDLSLETLDVTPVPPVLKRRALHVLTENTRTLAAAEAMQRGDARTLGNLMTASHASLRDDYEVSCPELDTIVSLARAQPGCLGARMTGAGFGGCAIALVETAHTPRFIPAIAAAYQAQTGIEPAIFRALPAGAAEVIHQP
jgi:galactokinase